MYLEVMKTVPQTFFSYMKKFFCIFYKPFTSLSGLLYKKKPPSVFVLFFGGKGEECKTCLKTEKTCDKTPCHYRNLEIVQHFISHTQRTLDVCVCLITFDSLVDSLIALKRRGIRIRVIIDKGMLSNANKSLQSFHRLLQWHIAVKLVPQSAEAASNTMMHNKFTIIDRQTVINGSLNWTATAFFGNFENMVVITDTETVSQFELYFEKIWTDCIFS